MTEISGHINAEGSEIKQFRALTIFFIFIFSIMTISVLIAWDNPEIGYEISIYESTPSIFWVSMLFLMLTSFILALYLIYGSHTNILFHKLCLFTIYACYIIINSIFIIRGYYMWNMTGDGATHLGWIKELMSTGYIPSDLFYPFIHIFTAELSDITALNLVVLHKFVPIIFGTLFVPYMFILSRSVLPKGNKGTYIVTLASCAFILPCTLLAPNLDSCLFFPLMLMIFIKVMKSNNTNFLALLFIILIDVVIFHPITAFIFGLVMLTVILYSFHERRGGVQNDLPSNSRIGLVLILGVWFFSWLTQFKYFESTLSDMYQSLTQMLGAQYDVIGGAIANSSAVGNNPIVEIFQVYGQQIIILSLAGFSIVHLYYHHRHTEQYRSIRVMAIPFFVIVLITVSMVAVMGFTMATRYLSYVLVIGVLFCAYFIDQILSTLSNKSKIYSTMAILSIMGVMISILIVGFLGVYPSPYNAKASDQTTQMSISGMGWYFEHRNDNTPLTGITVAPGRYADLLLSPDERDKQNLPNYMYIEYGGRVIEDIRPLFHFGYNASSSLKNYYHEDTDMITNQQDIDYYSITRPELGSLYWNEEDFHELLYDHGVCKVYCDNEYTMWKIAC